MTTPLAGAHHRRGDALAVRQVFAEGLQESGNEVFLHKRWLRQAQPTDAG